MSDDSEFCPDPEDTLEAVRKGYIDDTMIVSAKRSLLLVGENVVVCPTEADQVLDRQNKYFLGLNIGKIVDINHELQQVQLWWYYGKKWNDDSWILWVDPKTNKPYKQWMHVEDLKVDDIGRIVRITMEQSNRKRRRSYFKLSHSSVKTIDLCLKIREGMLAGCPNRPDQSDNDDTDRADSE